MRREGDFQGEFPIYRDGLASGPIYHPLGQLQLPHHLVSTPERNATSSEANFQLIREWVETIWNEAQCDQLPRFHPPFFDNHGKPTAIEETRQWHVRMRATYPDLHYTIDDIFTVGDRVALRWTARARSVGHCGA